MNIDNTVYGLFAQMQQDPAFQSQIIDNLNVKYNNTFWKIMCDLAPLTQSKKFRVLMDEANISVKSSLLSAEGKKPLRSFEGAKLMEGSIHKTGHGFSINQSDISTIQELNLVNPNIAKEILRKYNNRASSIIQGMHSTWNSWVYQGLSTGKISLLSGDKKIQHEVSLNIPKANILKVMGQFAWFDSNYIGKKSADLVRMDEQADAVGMSPNRAYYISKSLANKMIGDEQFRKSIVATKGFVNLDDVEVSRKTFLSAISETFDIPRFIVIDEKSKVEKNGTPIEDAKSFDENMIVLAPIGKLFTMHRSPSDYEFDGNPNTVKTFFENRMIGAMTTYSSDPFNMIMNFESWAFPTLKNPNHVVSLNTSLFSTTGK